MNDGRIVAMTYAKFGKMCEEDAFFVDKLDYIICDELPSLLVFKGIKNKKPERNTTFHKTAKNEIVRAIKRGNATVIALTATPKRIYRDMCDCVINPIKVDTEQLIQFETKKTINYNSLNAVFDKVSKGEIDVANEIVDKKMKELLPQIYQEAYTNAYRSFMEDLAFDVTTCVKVAFDNGEIILNDQRNQRIIAEHIMEELSKQIRDKLTLSI